jgi:hypothetical protein
MIRIRQGKVRSIIARRNGYCRIELDMDGNIATAVNYSELTGEVEVGDTVIVNTSAVHLNLGTGGNHFVMGIVDKPRDLTGIGHIMKMRYTPFQNVVLSVEEPKSLYHDLFDEGNLQGTPVIAAGLHSMLLPAAMVLKYFRPDCKVVYVMTDGGALPLKLSDQVDYMKIHGYLEAVVTCGHAFGGDYEAVNLFSGILAAKHVCKADVIICTMGPGVVGTGTVWGNTAIEQGLITDAVNVLKGTAVAALRISFVDPRKRHIGISHHCLTALGLVALSRCLVAVPYLPDSKRSLIKKQLKESNIASKHDVKEYDTGFTMNLFEKSPFQLTTMGRTVNEDPWSFLSAAAASLGALEQMSEPTVRD